MRLRNVTGSREVIAACDYVIHNPQECRGLWHEVFGNGHPIRIEIGMGKGRFIMDLARQNSEHQLCGDRKIFQRIDSGYTETGSRSSVKSLFHPYGGGRNHVCVCGGRDRSAFI